LGFDPQWKMKRLGISRSIEAPAGWRCARAPALRSDRPKGPVCAGGRAGCASGVRAPAAAGHVRATATQFPGDARDVETHASITEHRKQVKEDTAKAEAGEGQHLDVLGRDA
jgi:hypothetical protein